MDNLQEKDWPSLKPVNNVKCDSVKDKKCDLCSFVTHKSYNLKKHRKIHDRVPVEKSVLLSIVTLGVRKLFLTLEFSFGTYMSNLIFQ